MKKLLLTLSTVALFLSPTAAFAKGYDNGKDNPLKVTMTYETYTGEVIYRQYLDKDGMNYDHYLEIPEEYAAQVNKAKDPLLEAKKVLTSIYTNLELEERLAEVNGSYIDTIGYIDTTFDDILKERFEEDKKIATAYSVAQKKIYEALSDEEKAALYDTSLEIYRDHSDYINEIFLSQEEIDEINDVMNKEHEAEKEALKSNNDKTDKDSNESTSTGLIAGIVLSIAVLGGIVFIVIRKRR